MSKASRHAYPTFSATRDRAAETRQNYLRITNGYCDVFTVVLRPHNRTSLENSWQREAQSAAHTFTEAAGVRSSLPVAVPDLESWSQTMKKHE